MAALAALAFAVGIGSATAIYTVVNGVMLKPLPYPEARRFVALYGATFSQPDQRSSLTFPDLIEYQQRTHSFDVFGWFRPGSFSLTYGGHPQHVSGLLVTRSLAEHIGVGPALGTWFRDDSSVVISHALWTRLGAPADIVGRSMTVDRRPVTVSGVMPASFRLPVPGPGIGTVRSDVWLPLDPTGRGQNPGEGAYFCYARVKPGVAFASAEADIKRAAAEIAALDPASHPSYTARLDALRDSVVNEIRPTLLLLVAASALLFLIACADVAGLLLARAMARARETAIRVALGARRRQLAAQYITDALVVSLAGGLVGLAVSAGLVRGVLALAADEIPRADEIGLDWSVVVFVLAAAIVAAALAGLAPLGHALRTVPTEALSVGVRSSGSRRTRLLSHALVVAEVALSFALLAVSAAFVLHLRGLTRVAPGLDPAHVLTFDISPPDTPGVHMARAEQIERFATALATISGVTDVGYSNQTPLAGCCFGTTIYPEGRPKDVAAGERTSFMAVSPGYFRTMRLPLTRGRLLDDHDRSENPLRVLVNEAAVRRYWPNEDPLQRYGHLSAPNGTRFQIVGVVGDVKNDGLGKPTVPEIYLLGRLVDLSGAASFSVRSLVAPAALVPEVRRAVESVDPSQPIHDVATMEQIVAQSLSVERVSSLMVTFFALSALLMATLGLYGVVSYSVRQITVEIGTRMALGAVSRDLLAMIVGGGLKTAALGIAIGGVVSLAAAGMLTRAFEIDPSVMPYLGSAVIVAAVAALASFVPAWRATLVSPMVAIRNDPGPMLWLTAREASRRAWVAIAGAVSEAREFERAPDAGLVAELVAAARGAGSYREAFQRALETLCEALGGSSAFLFERGHDGYVCIARTPEGSDPPPIPPGGFLLNRLRFYRYALPLAAADVDAWRKWAAGRPARIGEPDALAAIDARLAIALRAGDDILGILILGPPAGRPAYSRSERTLVRQSAGQLTLMIENARLTGRVVEQEKLRRDLALAAEVQKRLLPERAPEREAAALSAVSLPARSVGGDYYDFLELGDHRVGIALADVSGKGVPAALIMAVVQASLRIVAADGEIPLPQLVARINDCVYRSTQSKSYATFFYAQLDEGSRRLRYVNAGHMPPYLVRSVVVPEGGSGESVEIQELPASGTVVGLFPDMSYEEAAVDLRPGDVLVAFTDGVTEALNTAEEEYGEERLKSLLRAAAPLPASEISDRISSELKAWIKDTAQYDDLTFVVVKVN